MSVKKVSAVAAVRCMLVSMAACSKQLFLYCPQFFGCSSQFFSCRKLRRRFRQQRSFCP